MTELRNPVRMRWEEYRSRFKWVSTPAGGRECHRLEYPALQADSFRAQLMVVPTAQSILEQSHAGDAIYLGLEGELEFSIADRKIRLGHMDMLSVPAGAPYGYTNIGLVNAVAAATFSNAPAADAPSGKVEHLAWSEYRARFGWTLPLAEQWGYHRGSGPLMSVPGLRGHTVRMPMGQTTPWHHVPRDLYFMAIKGEIEFLAGGQVWRLAPYDMLHVPAGVPYQYRNSTLSETLFYSMGGKLPAGKKGVYYSEDPGWPPRPDAPTLRVELDPYGDARVVKAQA